MGKGRQPVFKTLPKRRMAQREGQAIQIPLPRGFWDLRSFQAGVGTRGVPRGEPTVRSVRLQQVLS